jgi:hypothetical protein
MTMIPQDEIDGWISKRSRCEETRRLKAWQRAMQIPCIKRPDTLKIQPVEDPP